MGAQLGTISGRRREEFEKMPAVLLCEAIVGTEPDDLSLEVVANICIRVINAQQRAHIFLKLEENDVRGKLVGVAFKQLAGSDYDRFIVMVDTSQITGEKVREYERLALENEVVGDFGS